MQETYEVLPFSERKLLLKAKRPLRRARREGRTGLLAYASTPGSVRVRSKYSRTVLIKEGDRKLFSGDWISREVQWVDLAPGTHEITFIVGGPAGNLRFTREIIIARQQILIAACRTTYRVKPFSRERYPNRWYIGVVEGRRDQP